MVNYQLLGEQIVAGNGHDDEEMCPNCVTPWKCNGPHILPDQVVGTGMKYDGEKPRMDLLDPDFLEHVAQVLTFGAQKYAAHNWRQGINVSRLIAAAYRHLGAINRGEDIDPESGQPHTAHLGCCVMFLDWTLANRKELDDRYKL